MKSTDLAPGLRTVLTEFESSVRAHAIKQDYVSADGDYGSVDQTDHEELAALAETMDRKKQAVIRKLLRMQNGEELVDVEQLKRRLRRMARFINNIDRVMHDPKALEVISALFASSPEVLEDVEKLIASRRKF